MKSLVLAKFSEALYQLWGCSGWLLKVCIAEWLPSRGCGCSHRSCPIPTLPLGMAEQAAAPRTMIRLKTSHFFHGIPAAGVAGSKLGEGLAEHCEYLTWLQPLLLSWMCDWSPAPCVTFLSHQGWETPTFINTVSSPIPCCSLIFYFHLLVLTPWTTWSQVTLSDCWGDFSPCNQ